MTLDADAAYLALKSRDARFDGRLFVGVTSTRIYCRPICRVRTPKRENCRFFETPAQAEAQAFRPCLKCRPEIAPGPGLAWSVMDASSTLAKQAADWLDTQAASGDAPRLAALASRLGVSDRHLRRIFQAEHGVTPVQYLQTRRLLTAKQLLTDTRLPVSQVALASGFASLRRFNAAFAQSYRMSPSRLRGDTADEGVREADAIGVALGYRAPYDVERLLRFLTQRAIPGVEVVEGLSVRRTLRAGLVADAPGWIAVEFVPASSRVRLRFAPAFASASVRLVAAVRRWLDLDATPQTIALALATLPGEEGLRLPGSLDGFELALRAVLGQQVTVAAARTLARRLVERFGEPVATPWDDVSRAFPSPERIAAATLDDVASLGIIRTRANAILALARGWHEIAPRLQPHQPPEPLIDALCELPGIGPWTAHYIAMRALSWPDAFPPNDVAVLKAMKRLYDRGTQREADAIAQAWRPWRAYAVLRLWNSLENTP
ncbi:MAG TPA: Ada metal-binding domain-containing protein [Albitalea sp.]|uniref:Ada metal-binding domain-containing protein n=1 Tax=Piscinibacter sp. TaxID=1903157 RepID=UPI002ED4AFBD